VDGVSDGGDGGFARHGQASHTPVSDGERVYVMFGSSGVKVYDLSGEEIWEQQLGNERASRFGTASSPILYKDYLIVTAGAESESMRAFNKKTGEEAWKADASGLSASYSTPLIVTNPNGVDELLISVTEEVWSLNPLTGKMKWYAETRVDTAACPSVIASEGIAYIIGGRGGGRTAVRVEGKGDVTESNVLWSETGGSYVPSPVLHDGRLYWVNDRGIASCVDAKSGEELGRKRLGGRFYASVVLVDDKLYAVSRFDGTHVLKPTPDFEQIAHNKLSDESDFSGSPAVSNGQLFIRSDEYLYCIEAE
jgi:outer membrane protein assembly factor BamB